jgi:hypothetical protein
MVELFTATCTQMTNFLQPYSPIISFSLICIHPLGRCSNKTRQAKLVWDVVMHWIYIEVWLTAKPFLFVSIENFICHQESNR